MQTLKSTTVIVVLLGTLYGVYIVLGKPSKPANRGGTHQAHEHEHEAEGPQIEFASPSTSSPQVAVEAPGSGSAMGSPASLTSPGSMTMANQPPPAAPAYPPASAYTPPQPTSPYQANPEYSPAPYSPPPSTYGSGGDAAGNAAPIAQSAAERPNGYLAGNNYSASLIPPSSEAPPTSVQPALGVETPNYGGALTSSQVEVPTQPTPAMTAYSWRQLWSQAENLVAQDKLRETLALLSPYYNHPDTPAEQREGLKPWLDALASRVIYSKEHLLESPYDARAKETLYEVADRCQVPWEVLHNINHDVVSDPQLLVVGTRLKLIRGPFNAHVSTARQELTIYLNDLYAGRFPISIGSEPPKRGTHKVTDKSRDRTYYGPDSRIISARDPANPYGGYWLELGMHGSIHGSPTAASNEALGSVSLSPQDAKDLYGILSKGSMVVVE